jgi:hypothetical protein
VTAQPEPPPSRLAHSIGDSTMKTSRNALRRAVAIATLALLPLAFAGSAQAYVCKNTKTQVETSGLSQAIAKSRGRTAWAKKVKAAYGLEWSVWDIATSRSQTCEASGNTYQCVTKAKPCQYVVP